MQGPRNDWGEGVRLFREATDIENGPASVGSLPRARHGAPDRSTQKILFTGLSATRDTSRTLLGSSGSFAHHSSWPGLSVHGDAESVLGIIGSPKWRRKVSLKPAELRSNETGSKWGSSSARLLQSALMLFACHRKATRSLGLALSSRPHSVVHISASHRTAVPQVKKKAAPLAGSRLL